MTQALRKPTTTPPNSLFSSLQPQKMVAAYAPPPVARRLNSLPPGNELTVFSWLSFGAK